MSDNTNTEAEAPKASPLPKTLTGYQMAKLVNQVLKDKGFDKEIPAQMIYSYIKQGFIKSVVVGSQNRVEFEVAKAWILKYIARKEEAKHASQITL